MTKNERLGEAWADYDAARREVEKEAAPSTPEPSGPMTPEEIDAGFGRPCGHVCGIPQAEHRHEEHPWASSLRSACKHGHPGRSCWECYPLTADEAGAPAAPSTPEPSGLRAACDRVTELHNEVCACNGEDPDCNWRASLHNVLAALRAAPIGPAE